MDEREPIFNVPGAVLAVLAVLLAVHGIRQVLPGEDDAWLVLALSFIPGRYLEGVAAELPGGEWAAVTSFVSHALVHGSWPHLILNSAWLMAFGAAVTQRVGSIRFLLFSALCAAAGAGLFLVLNPGLMVPMVGASGAISGLMGAAMRFLFAAIDDGGLRQLRDQPRSVRLMGLAETLRDRRVQTATAMWLLLNIAAMFGFGSAAGTGGIAWEAHIGGFIAGLMLFGWADTAPRERTCETPGLQ